jgi:hypothetical protein
LSISVD